VTEGHVEAIYVTAKASELPRSVPTVTAVSQKGLVGDRYFDGTGFWSDYPVETGRDLTLVEAEVLEEVGLTGADARRNVVTRGVSLLSLIGKRFRVGEVQCYGDRICEPCSHLESLTRPGIVEALAHRGGLRADVLRGGKIAVGDPVILVSTSRPSNGRPDRRASRRPAAQPPRDRA
jgi:MOSC domain-containing protein YiiM